MRHVVPGDLFLYCHRWARCSLTDAHAVAVADATVALQGKQPPVCGHRDARRVAARQGMFCVPPPPLLSSVLSGSWLTGVILPSAQAWVERMKARPAVRAGLQIP